MDGEMSNAEYHAARKQADQERFTRILSGVRHDTYKYQHLRPENMHLLLTWLVNKVDMLQQRLDTAETKLLLLPGEEY